MATPLRMNTTTSGRNAASAWAHSAVQLWAVRVVTRPLDRRSLVMSGKLHAGSATLSTVMCSASWRGWKPSFARYQPTELPTTSTRVSVGARLVRARAVLTRCWSVARLMTGRYPMVAAITTRATEARPRDGASTLVRGRQPLPCRMGCSTTT